ncbi:MAG: hypothetical protein H8D97_01445 [Proteobacteria bacterium]|nr:hypothetical protein [Pseudomonadota bacterium]
MITIVTLILALLTIYTEHIILEILLYIVIFGFSLMWAITITRDKSDYYQIFEKLIGPNTIINHNNAVIQVMVVFLPLAFGEMWILAGLWVIGISIQHTVIYNYIQSRNNNYGRKYSKT